ncbi:MAG: PilZ domain-containing protein [Syntrophobacterales bacterium]|nr:MAG: PilZ domain-containing protein [Syntrophobacterales bacterium]
MIKGHRDMNVSLRGVKHFANGYSGKTQAIYEKRKFPRYPVMKTAVCFRYGRQMTMQTINISLGGLKVEANFDLRVGESMVFAILTNGIRIQCKGRILAIEELKNKVYARLCFAYTSDKDLRNLSDYLDTLSPGRRILFQKGIIAGLLILSAYIAYLIIRTYLFR